MHREVEVRKTEKEGGRERGREIERGERDESLDAYDAIQVVIYNSII